MDRVKRLEEVAAAYGADPAHWPIAERAMLEETARAHPGILSEASEIDRVLAAAAIVPEARGGQSRLLQSIAASRPASTGNVIAVPARRVNRSPAWSWAAAMTLAASLACGIYLGTLDTASFIFDPDNTVSDDPVDLAGLGDVSDFLEDET